MAPKSKETMQWSNMSQISAEFSSYGTETKERFFNKILKIKGTFSKLRTIFLSSFWQIILVLKLWQHMSTFIQWLSLQCWQELSSYEIKDLMNQGHQGYCVFSLQWTIGLLNYINFFVLISCPSSLIQHNSFLHLWWLL